MAGLSALWDLEGHWTLQRRITHSDGRVDTLNGTAVFQRSDDRLLQIETGMLQVEDQKLEASQRYIWAVCDTDLQVFFADSRPFHSVALGVASPKADHFCAPDTYDVQYDFSNWPNWLSTWNVHGPRKSYAMTSTYGPCSS